MKKIYVVNINNYWPELMQHTLPNLKDYADKIGFEFELITERKFEGFPITYEKLQVYDLAKDNEWSMLIDADTLIHPDSVDFTKTVPPDHIGLHTGYEASSRFVPDKYFYRDGRNRGVVTSFIVWHNMCHDIWNPLEFEAEEAKTKTNRWWIIDEYCVSRNLAKYGIKYTGLISGETFHHIEHLGGEEKTVEEKNKVVERAQNFIKTWEKL